MSKTAKHHLQEPIVVDGTTYGVLTFEKLKAKHLKHIPEIMWELQETTKEDLEKNPLTPKQNMQLITELIPLMAALANVPEDVIGELDINELTKVSELVMSFLA